jgi:poly(hydroxyalkanoate) depolymerase family esterase
MKFSLGGMKAATDLTRSGKLLEATALIQQLLSERSKTRGPDAEPAPLFKSPLLPNLVAREQSNEEPSKANSQRISAPQTGSGRTSFETKQFVCDLGQRTYKLFTPSSYVGEPMPLVVMLHGCTQTPDDFAAGTQMNALGEELGFLVAYPLQSSSANANGCWNWFKSFDQQKDKGEPALLAGITREIMVDRAVDVSRVYVAGLSAGGAMAAILGMTYPELFAAIGVHSGLPCGAATDVVSAFAVMKRGAKSVAIARSAQAVPTIVFHGERDQTVNPANADAVLEQFNLSSAQYQTTSENSSKGMRYSKSVHLTDSGKPMFEKWLVNGAGHAWSGGSARGSYTEPRGPDASREMVRFFLQHRLTR